MKELIHNTYKLTPFYLILAGIIFLNTTTIFAQDEIKALEKRVGLIKDKWHKTDTLNILSAKSIEYNKFDLAIKYAQDALEVSGGIKYYHGSAKALLNFANVYRLKRQFQLALDYALQGVNIYEEQADLIALYDAYTNIAYLYQDWNVFENAIQYEKKALRVAEKLKDERKKFNITQLLAFAYLKTGQDDMAMKHLEICKEHHKKTGDKVQYISMLSRIASLHTKNRNYQEALNTNLEILRLKRESGDIEGTATYLNDIGFNYEKLNDSKMAVKYFKEAINLNRQLGKPESANATLLSNVAVLTLRSGNISKALESYYEVLKIRTAQGNPGDIAQAHLFVASAYMSREQYNEARKHIEQAIMYAKQADDFALVEKAHSRLVSIYERSNNYRKAYQAMKGFLALKDSVIALEKARQREWVNSRLAAEQKEKELEKVLMDKKMKELEIEKLRSDSEKRDKQLELLEIDKALKESALREEAINKDRAQKQLLLTQQQLLSEKRNIEISELQKDRKLQELQLRQKETEEREREKELELIQQEKELQDLLLAEKEKQDQYYAIGFALSAAVLILILTGYFQNRKKNKRLAAKNKEVLQQKTEIEKQRDQISDAKQEVDKANGDFQVLSDFGQKITSTLEFQAINWTAFSFVNSLMDAAVFGIAIFDDKRNILEFSDMLDNGVHVPPFNRKVDATNSLAALCFKTQEEVYINSKKEISNYLTETPCEHVIDDRPESYMYIPLIADNKPLGVVTVQSHEIDVYSKKDMNILRSMASYISIALTNANSYKLINTKNKHITDSIRYAQTIQKAILPTVGRIKREFLDAFVLYRPKDIVSGDYYWFLKLEGDELNRNSISNPFTESLTFIAAIDCTGHGVPGGFMSMIGNTLLNQIVTQKHIYTPSEILDTLNNGIIRALRQESKTNDDGMDVCLCVIEKSGTDKDKVTFCGAKRPLWYMPYGGKKLEELKGSNKSIGGYYPKKLQKSFDEHVLELEKGSLLYLTTDGYADQNNVGGKKLGKLQLMEIIEKNASKAMLDQKGQLEETLDTYQDKAAQRDDITIIGLRI